jgi:hypothetical protein
MKTDYDLFKHMADEWGLTLTGSELHEIRIAAGLLERERENAKLRDAISAFCAGASWSHAEWKNQPHIKPLFDLANVQDEGSAPSENL